MKKSTIASIVLFAVTYAMSAEYIINMAIPTTQSVQTNVVATSASVESLSVVLARQAPVYAIRFVLKDADGNVVDRKTIRLSHAQAEQLMPEINTILTSAQSVVSENINTILSE